jgi:hypothetical protein
MKVSFLFNDGGEMSFLLLDKDVKAFKKDLQDNKHPMIAVVDGHQELMIQKEKVKMVILEK